MQAEPSLCLFDTHTHFDVPEFDVDRERLAVVAKKSGVDALILIGFLASRFGDLVRTHHTLQQLENAPKSYLAPGLHPFYIEQHLADHVHDLEQLLKVEHCVAIGEIGLDTFLKQHKQPQMYQKQREYFAVQLELAKNYQKPVLLHIRKAHADVLQQLKQHKFKFGGIAHAFSGGVEEAKALIKMGFKIGVTGQITNPQAKKLHQVVQVIGAEHLVIETDCPDMTPLCCQDSTESRTRNTPVNLIYVLQGLAQSLNLAPEQLAPVLWHNSLTALHLSK
ncbi:TatD family hydrolase [Acinetobacter sp. MD2(2019)]|uniref:TatD family hydrolase n=1 Tax=Acinetobacter sp. MD2(2019) TaxID=2605273 RepID=UPI002D1EDD96|nr:TatD family hydrolase [Acinetobacter sp. MD2(2019)]MEB3753636.1 TatD family hydrolase [Acinetobacter sp. MD2(2019)]